MNSTKILSFKDLVTWQEGHKLALMIYKLTKEFPKDEQFGLTSQMRRAAISVTSNIAEGFGRSSFREKHQFYTIALGSLTEVQSQLIVAHDVGYVSIEDFNGLEIKIIEVRKILSGLIKSSRNRSF